MDDDELYRRLAEIDRKHCQQHHKIDTIESVVIGVIMILLTIGGLAMIVAREFF